MSGMKKVVIAFDIDGTLRCNCTATCGDKNPDVVQLALLLNKMKNTHLIAWSGGGKNYAQAFINRHSDLQKIFGTRCYGKTDGVVPDIAVDDIQDFELGDINLIVREK